MGNRYGYSRLDLGIQPIYAMHTGGSLHRKPRTSGREASALKSLDGIGRRIRYRIRQETKCTPTTIGTAGAPHRQQGSRSLVSQIYYVCITIRTLALATLPACLPAFLPTCVPACLRATFPRLCHIGNERHTHASATPI